MYKEYWASIKLWLVKLLWTGKIPGYPSVRNPDCLCVSLCDELYTPLPYVILNTTLNWNTIVCKICLTMNNYTKLIVLHNDHGVWKNNIFRFRGAWTVFVGLPFHHLGSNIFDSIPLCKNTYSKEVCSMYSN